MTLREISLEMYTLDMYLRRILVQRGEIFIEEKEIMSRLDFLNSGIDNKAQEKLGSLQAV